jgi:ribosome biogenesis GTPase
MTNLDYAALGWTAHFARQADADDLQPRRIAEIHRDRATAIHPGGTETLVVPEGTDTLAVGDWVATQNGIITRILDRQTILSRRAAGSDARIQLIGANVTALAIVTSCNADFNERRLERYLVLATEAGCLPLAVLTKADQAQDPGDYLRRAERVSPLLTAVAIDATDPLDLKRLYPWCRDGDTLALVGSSGVGKTTIRNGLTGEDAETQDIRGDAKGRHTTTSRALVRTLAGGWLIDTPGMRALRLADVSDGIEAVFADLEELAHACRFSDCAHETEPGCAVQAAIENGTIEPDRLRRWRKLRAEDARNSETIAEARARDRGFGRMVKGAMARKNQDRGD